MAYVENVCKAMDLICITASGSATPKVLDTSMRNTRGTSKKTKSEVFNYETFSFLNA